MYVSEVHVQVLISVFILQSVHVWTCRFQLHARIKLIELHIWTPNSLHNMYTFYMFQNIWANIFCFHAHSQSSECTCRIIKILSALDKFLLWYKIFTSISCEIEEKLFHLIGIGCVTLANPILPSNNLILNKFAG